MLFMRTTLDLPDDLFRESKAQAALRGQSLRAFVTEALAAHLARDGATDSEPPWRALFGAAEPRQTREVDSVVESEFGRIEPERWE